MKIQNCDKIEVLEFTKEKRDRLLATISMKDGKPVVESDDAALKKDIERLLSFWQPHLKLTRRDSSGFSQRVIVPQDPGDKFYMVALTGPWGKVLNHDYVWARPAGKIWEDDYPD